MAKSKTPLDFKPIPPHSPPIFWAAGQASALIAHGAIQAFAHLQQPVHNLIDWWSLTKIRKIGLLPRHFIHFYTRGIVYLDSKFLPWLPAPWFFTLNAQSTSTGPLVASIDLQALCLPGADPSTRWDVGKKNHFHGEQRSTFLLHPQANCTTWPKQLAMGQRFTENNHPRILPSTWGQKSIWSQDWGWSRV